tara:strand:+ start:51 stop:338 length:288 start_codon:yes stop_codon:yes gene_type:complete
MPNNSTVDDAIQINIELEDLHELARINPLAWEQLLHIVDNRHNVEQITALQEQLQRLGKSSKDLVDIQKDIIQSDKEFISELTGKTFTDPLASVA